MKTDNEKDTTDKDESEPSSEGVKIPEEFQKEVYDLIESADNKEKLSYIRDCCYQKENELRKAEESKKGKNKVPSEYSLSDMPK